MRALAVACALLLGACYAPKIADGQYDCDRDADCPTGFHCSRCGTCIMSSEPVDMCQLANPCTNGDKQRAQGDPGHPRVALCPAAFQSPGVTAAPSCDYAPGPYGYVPGDLATPCSIADNCAPGWRVCDDDTLAKLGFTTSQCTSVMIGFFISAQAGVPSYGSLVCAATGDSVVFGCGAGGQAASCTVLGGALTYSGCEPTFANCSGLGNINIRARITRPDASQPGGVMCCRDTP